MEKKETQEWEIISLYAFNIAFNTDGSLKDIENRDKQKAIDLFYRGISMSPDTYWPYIKLADLVSDTKEKTKLYLQAWKAEKNQYSANYLLNIILTNQPDILDCYI
jgi:hypothetical protein